MLHQRVAPIVLVEDTQEDAYFVRYALQTARIANPLVVFGMASQARQHFADTRADLPALFIVDVNLAGGENGIDFLRWVRQQQPPLSTTPAMMLTGSTRPEDQNEAERLGSVHFLIKPVTGDTVTSAVQSLGFVVAALGSDFTMQRTIERRS